MKSKLNLMIFASINFVLALIMLLVIPNPVPISIAKRFIVGELGSKWILLCFLGIGILLPLITFVGKQKTPEQKQLAKTRQIYISILLTIWIEVIYFFICLFNNQKIIGSRVLISVMSLIMIFVACMFSLFGEQLERLKVNGDNKREYYINLTIYCMQISGYVLLVLGGVNIVIDSLLIFILGLAVAFLVCGLVPLITIKVIENNNKKIALLNEAKEQECLDKLDSAINFASISSKQQPEAEDMAKTQTKKSEKSKSSAIKKTNLQKQSNSTSTKKVSSSKKSSINSTKSKAKKNKKDKE